MIEFATARSGDPIVRYDGRSLVSTVDPVREAERFVNQDPPEGSTVIVIGAVHDYLDRALRALCPRARVLRVHLHPATRTSSANDPDAWFPGHPQPLFAFLSARVSESEALRVSVIEWKPAIGAFAAASRDARTSVLEFLRQNQASFITIGAQGSVWLRNLVCNYPTITPARISRPPGHRYAAALVVASGPSLERSIAAIDSVRPDVFVLATGSSTEFLLSNGISPDMVIVTDSSPFASEQLRGIIDDSAVPIAAPLTACRALTDAAHVVPFIQDQFLEPDLLAVAQDDPTTVASHGTVTASAIALLRTIDSWPILIAGLDCAWFAGRSHARPHIAEHYRDIAADRFAPAATSGFAATIEHTTVGSGWTQDRSLGTYAQWFARGAASLAPLRAIEPSPALGTIPVWDRSAHIGDRAYRDIEVVPVIWPSATDRRALVRGKLNEIVKATEDALLRAPVSSRPTGAEPTALPAPVLETARRIAVSQLLRYERDPSPTNRRELGDAMVARLDALRGHVR